MYYGKLKKLHCGKITARGWLKEQLERSKNGMGGHLDELDTKMFYDPYINKSTTNVVVLIPPAVEAGLPPINISKQDSIKLGFVKVDWLKVAKPAVLVVTLWKKQLTILLKVV